MGILSGISKREITAGGVQYALIAKMSDVAMAFVENTGSTESTVTYTLADGSPITSGNTPFKRYAFTQETANGDAAQVGTPNQGTSVFTHTVNMTFHKRDAALRNEIQVLAKNELVLVLVDCEGYSEGYGGQCDKGLLMTAGTAPTGTAGADLNGYTTTLTATQKNMPYTVTSAHLAEITPA